LEQFRVLVASPKISKPIQGRVDITLNTVFTSPRLIGGWASAVALIVAASMAMGASLSTTAFVLALCITAGIVMVRLAHNAPSPTVAQILHAVDAKDGRS
jgi:hypothetical protein